MRSHGPFGHLQHKLCAKEEQFDSRPLKVGNRPNLGVRKGSATHHWKSSQGELQVCFRPCPDRRFEQRVMTSWSPRTPNRDNFGTPPWESHDKKAIQMWVRWSSAENTIWGKVVASPESRPWWVKWVRVARCLSQQQ
jgi:hypothetical protein